MHEHPHDNLLVIKCVFMRENVQLFVSKLNKYEQFSPALRVLKFKLFDSAV